MRSLTRRTGGVSRRRSTSDKARRDEYQACRVQARAYLMSALLRVLCSSFERRRCRCVQAPFFLSAFRTRRARPQVSQKQVAKSLKPRQYPHGSPWSWRASPRPLYQSCDSRDDRPGPERVWFESRRDSTRSAASSERVTAMSDGVRTQGRCRSILGIGCGQTSCRVVVRVCVRVSLLKTESRGRFLRVGLNPLSGRGSVREDLRDLAAHKVNSSFRDLARDPDHVRKASTPSTASHSLLHTERHSTFRHTTHPRLVFNLPRGIQDIPRRHIHIHIHLALIPRPLTPIIPNPMHHHPHRLRILPNFLRGSCERRQLWEKSTDGEGEVFSESEAERGFQLRVGEGASHHEWVDAGWLRLLHGRLGGREQV